MKKPNAIDTFNRLSENAYKRKGYRTEGEFVDAISIPASTYYRHKKSFTWTVKELMEIFRVGDWRPQEVVEAMACRG